MTYQELVEGQIYVAPYIGQGDYIIMFGFPDIGALNNETPQKKRWTTYTGINPNNGFHEYRLATPKERYQFLQGLKCLSLDETIFSPTIIY